MSSLMGDLQYKIVKIVVVARRLRLLDRWLDVVLIDAWSAHSCNLDGLLIAILTVDATSDIHVAPALQWSVISNPAMSCVLCYGHKLVSNSCSS